MKPIKRGPATSRTALPWAGRGFYVIPADLTIDNGIILFKDRIVVPEASRQHLLAALYSCHSGAAKTKRLARQCVFWPGMGKDIKVAVASYPPCRERLPSLGPETLLLDPPPAFPFS